MENSLAVGLTLNVEQIFLSAVAINGERRRGALSVQLFYTSLVLASAY